MLSGLLTFTVFVAMLACGGTDAREDYVPELETRHVTVADAEDQQELTVELAVTGPQRTKGLMFRQDMPEEWGMLFLFSREQQGGFWMRNTYLPLDIAYLAADGTVLEIRQGQPLDETVLRPEQPYSMVLEVNQGWFDRHNMGVGAKVYVPNNLPEPD